MVSAGGGKEENLSITGEHRANHGDIRQVSAAIVGCIQNVGVPRLTISPERSPSHSLDTLRHGTEVHRHMGGIGDQRSLGDRKMAQEKSSRSLILTEAAVFSSTEPICSAIDMNRLLNTSSITGSAHRFQWRPPLFLGRGDRSEGCSLASRVALHPGSTTTVPVESSITHGPSMRIPRRQGIRARKRASPAILRPCSSS